MAAKKKSRDTFIAGNPLEATLPPLTRMWLVPRFTLPPCKPVLARVFASGPGYIGRREGEGPWMPMSEWGRLWRVATESERKELEAGREITIRDEKIEGARAAHRDSLAAAFEAGMPSDVRQPDSTVPGASGASSVPPTPANGFASAQANVSSHRTTESQTGNGSHRPPVLPAADGAAAV